MSKVHFRQQTRVVSGREARRIGEREQAKEARQKQIDAFWALSPEERKRRMADIEAFQRINRNGITVEDMKRAEERAYADGVNVGIENTMRTCYAAICMALKDLHGFGSDECKDVLNCVDERITMSLTSEEAIREVWDEMGLAIEFKNSMPGERVQET